MVLSQNPTFPSRFFPHLQDTQVDDVRMDVMQDLRHSEDVFVLKPNRIVKMFEGLESRGLAAHILSQPHKKISQCLKLQLHSRSSIFGINIQ